MNSSAGGLDYETLLADLAELGTSSRSLGDKPLIVLTQGSRQQTPLPGATPEQMARLGSAWQDLQAGLTHLSTNSAQVIAENCGHFIQLQAPKLVIASVRQVVDACEITVGPMATHSPLSPTRNFPCRHPTRDRHRGFTVPTWPGALTPRSSPPTGRRSDR
jgi:hypothetical protein